MKKKAEKPWLKENQVRRAQIGARINARMDELGLTLSEVSENTGVVKGTVWTWRKGKVSPSKDNITKLSKVLKTTPEWIWYGGSIAQVKTPIKTPQPEASDNTADNTIAIIALVIGLISTALHYV